MQFRLRRCGSGKAERVGVFDKAEGCRRMYFGTECVGSGTVAGLGTKRNTPLAEGLAIVELQLYKKQQLEEGIGNRQEPRTMLSPPQHSTDCYRKHTGLVTQIGVSGKMGRQLWTQRVHQTCW